MLAGISERKPAIAFLRGASEHGLSFSELAVNSSPSCLERLAGCADACNPPFHRVAEKLRKVKAKKIGPFNGSNMQHTFCIIPAESGLTGLFKSAALPSGTYQFFYVSENPVPHGKDFSLYIGHSEMALVRDVPVILTLDQGRVFLGMNPRKYRCLNDAVKGIVTLFNNSPSYTAVIAADRVIDVSVLYVLIEDCSVKQKKKMPSEPRSGYIERRDSIVFSPDSEGVAANYRILSGQEGGFNVVSGESLIATGLDPLGIEHVIRDIILQDRKGPLSFYLDPPLIADRFLANTVKGAIIIGYQTAITCNI